MNKQEIMQIMASGEDYNDWDPILNAERKKASKYIKKYKRAHFKVSKMKVLKKLVASCGESADFIYPFTFEFGFFTSIGEGFFANSGCIIFDCAPVTIGSDVMFGPNVGIFTSNHDEDPVKRSEGIISAKPITIGNNVWVGANVSILGGVTIGSDSIIGAGSVVTKSVPNGVIAAGNPCKTIREIRRS